MPALSENGRAKVNLTLRVVGRRTDGYHDIESVVAFADCADHLTLTPGSELDLRTSGPLAEACGATSDNLVIKAALLLRERVPDLKVGSFTLDKVLPVAAGIGGGSADAAAALRLLAQLNGLALDDPRLIEVAQLTGADVPVCRGLARLRHDRRRREFAAAEPAENAVRDGQSRAFPWRPKTCSTRSGLRNGELLVGATDVLLQDRSWPESRCLGRGMDRSVRGSRQRPRSAGAAHSAVIGEVLSALRDAKARGWRGCPDRARPALRFSMTMPTPRPAAEKIRRDHPVWWVHAGTLS